MKNLVTTALMTACLMLLLALTGLSFATEGEEGEAPVLQQLVNGAGTIQLSNENPQPGEEVTVTANAGEGYYLAQIRLATVTASDPGEGQQPGEGDPQPPEMTYQALQISGKTATFTMPDTDTIVFADFISIVWDGTIDLTWYDPGQETIEISYPAQLEGAAALTAGLFNDIPTREVTVGGKTANIPDITDEEGNVIELSEKDKQGFVSSNDGSGYQVFADNDGDGIDTTFVGDLSRLKILHDESEAGSNNVVTSNYYWFGDEDFTGKTIVLKRDLDMGGVLADGAPRTVMSSWTGPNYMPLGGQYSMDSNNGYTRLTAGFNGSFDGQGHMVYNLYVARHAPSATFGNCQAVGLIGLLGIYRVENGTMSKPEVRNVAIDGFINGNRSIGGIVGKTVHAKGAVIENCVNFATVYNTDAKGCGGIVGAAWFDASYGDKQPQIRNCANLGLVCTGYNKNAGGLVGSNESMVIDSYTIGYSTGEGKGNDNAGQALGTNNGGAVWYNCYTLEGAGSGKGQTPGSDTQQVYNSTYGSAIRVLADVAAMKRPDTVGLLNGKVRNDGPDENGYMDSDDDVIKNTKRNWTAGENTETKQFISSNMMTALKSIASWRNPQTTWPDSSAASSEFTIASIASRLTAVDGEGLPIPRVFFNDDSTIVDIVKTGTPTMDYLAGESFDTGDHSNQSTGPDDTDENSEFTVWAVFNDESYQELENYTVTYEGGATEFANTTDEETITTQVTVSGRYLGRDFSFDINGISVTKCSFLSMEITGVPNNQLYAKGEEFDPEGMVISEEYGIKGEDGAENDVRMTIKAAFSDGQIEITKQLEGTDTIIKLSGEAAAAYEYIFDEDRYNLTGGKTEMTVSHTFNGVTKTAATPITVLNSEAPRLIKDGENDKQIVYIASTDDFAWFANQITAGLDTDMDAVLEEDLSIGGNGFYPVGTRLVKGREKSNGYEGTFDGQNHKITLQIDRGYKFAGLFYGIASGGTIHDLTIGGSVTGGDKIGAFAAYIEGGSIKDCVNHANVTGKGTGNQTGGIAGCIRSADSNVSGCVNTGTIIGADAAGGIAGTAAKASIERSRNSGIVTGTDGSNLGGIVGTINSNDTTIINCYNQGGILGHELSADGKEGGIIGLIGSSYKTATVKNCYSSGKIIRSQDCADAGILIGKTSGFSNIKNNYALQNNKIGKAIGTSGTPDESNAVILSSDELKTNGAGKLGEAYKAVTDAYPVLSWEDADTVSADLEACEAKWDELAPAEPEPCTEHQWGEPEITKATLSANGTILTRCTVCGEEHSKTIYYPKTFTLSQTSYTYNGTAKKPTVTIKDATGNKVGASNYGVGYYNNVKAGKAIVKVTMKGNYYAGAKNLTFTIKQTANPMKVSGRTATLKYKALKKKTLTLDRSKVLTISKNQGALTFVKSSGNSKITINKTTGKVTVKKKIKKGTYSVKVKVRAAGNTNYKALAKTVTFKITVK